jgi:hypothetical protein
MAGAMHSSDLGLQPANKTTITKKEIETMGRYLNMSEWSFLKEFFQL